MKMGVSSVLGGTGKATMLWPRVCICRHEVGVKGPEEWVIVVEEAWERSEAEVEAAVEGAREAVSKGFFDEGAMEGSMAE